MLAYCPSNYNYCVTLPKIPLNLAAAPITSAVNNENIYNKNTLVYFVKHFPPPLDATMPLNYDMQLLDD